MTSILTHTETLIAIITALGLLATSLGRLLVGIATLRSSWRNANAIQAVHDCLDGMHSKIDAVAAVPVIGAILAVKEAPKEAA